MRPGPSLDYSGKILACPQSNDNPPSGKKFRWDLQKYLLYVSIYDYTCSLPYEQCFSSVLESVLTVASFAAEEEVFDAVKIQSRLTPDY